MANGITRIKLAEMARPNTPKGKALKSSLKGFNSSLMSVTGNEKQPKKGK